MGVVCYSHVLYALFRHEHYSIVSIIDEFSSHLGAEKLGSLDGTRTHLRIRIFNLNDHLVSDNPISSTVYYIILH